MRLISLHLQGYKRFQERTKVNLDGKLVALVGPNEAGKTTLLSALRRLDDHGEITRQERTRASAPPDDAIALEALWLVEDADLAEIALPTGCEPPRWFEVDKRFDGAFESQLIPALRRDRGPRQAAVKDLVRARTSRWLEELAADENVDFALGSLDELRELLEVDAETLPQETIDRALALAASLHPHLGDAPKYALGLVDDLRELADHEASEHPDDAARDALQHRTPDFLLFSSAERQLDSAYDLQAVLPETGQPIADAPPRALALLANLAGLNLPELRDLVAVDDFGMVVDRLEAANAELKARLDAAWGQADLVPKLENDNFVLKIMIRTGQGGYRPVAERSDGLRAFLALVAFTTHEARVVPPVLLIDEAEMYLHYDAQADLVQMLGRQQQAAQVIYTTHSAGCLPQDLGTGVRLVVAHEDQSRSTVVNWPWAEGGGFGPLLMGMGASTLAFVPTRSALIGEGASEVIVLPTLLREALGLSNLEFQIAPGAAEASRQSIARIDLEGNRVAWLVDGDAAGATIKAELRGSGIPEDRIIVLGGEGSGLVVEDLVAPAVYAKAVNEELRRSHGEAAALLPVERLLEVAASRPAVVKAWCEENDIPEPNKGAVAHRIADERSDRSLIDPDRLALVTRLHAQVSSLFPTSEISGS